MFRLICNMCGKELDLWDEQENFSVVNYNIGFGSKYDGCELRLDLCCDCMDKIIDQCKISPVKEKVPEFYIHTTTTAEG